MGVNKAQIKGKKAITRRVLVPLDDDQAKVLGDLAEAVGRARLVGDASAISKAEDLQRLGQDKLIEEGALAFTFRGIGRKPYEQLRLNNEPTDDQRAKALAESQPIQWNPDTFPAALCAASAVDCGDVDWLADVFESEEWGPGELAALFSAALEANSDRRVAQLGN